jgi:hypothetical protein
VVQFEIPMNHNEHERSSRKGAKAQRKALTSSLRLCAFAGDFFFTLMKLNHYQKFLAASRWPKRCYNPQP